jgi:hypothetical protein
MWTMQMMLAACVTYLLPFWPIHPPALAVHTSTSSSPMAEKASAYSPDCQYHNKSKVCKRRSHREEGNNASDIVGA